VRHNRTQVRGWGQYDPVRYFLLPRFSVLVCRFARLEMCCLPEQVPALIELIRKPEGNFEVRDVAHEAEFPGCLVKLDFGHRTVELNLTGRFD
jgi:hypothetical protein